MITNSWALNLKSSFFSQLSQMDVSPARGQGPPFSTQTPIVPGAQVRTPGSMVRSVRAQTAAALRQQSPQTRPLFSQPRVQVIHTQAGLRAALPQMVRQPMVINTSSLMPPAQGSQKLVSGANTNLARYVGFFYVKLLE